MANPYFTCVLDVWVTGTTIHARMHYYRSGTYTYQDTAFPNPTMTIAGQGFEDSGFGNWVRSGINVGDVYTTEFTKSVSANGTYGVSFSAGSGARSDFAGTWNGSATVTEAYTDPSTPSVSVKSKTYNSVTFTVSISSYGNPSGENGRYIEAALLENNSYDGSTSNRRRWQVAYRTTNANITVDNNGSYNGGSDGKGLTITGNSRYYYGGYATNTQRAKSVVTGQVYTPCPPLATLAYVSQSYSTYNKVNAKINYTRQADGGAETRTGYYRYSIDGGSTYSSWVSFGTVSAAAGTTANFTALLPTASSITLQAKLTTPNGGDSTTKTITFSTIATHTAPNFSNFEYRDTNATTVAMTGNDQTMIQGQSTPLVTISTTNKATGNNGVSVSNYAITFTGQSKTIDYSASSAVTTTLEPPTESGTGSLVVAAVDALSLSKAVSKAVTIYPWTSPTISASIERVNNFETQSKISASGTYSPITISGTSKNTLTFEYRTKKSSSSDWSEWTSRPVTISGSNWSVANFSVSLDNNYQWDVQTRIVDSFTDTTVNLILSVGMPNFFIGVDGRVSVGMKPNVTLPSGNKGQLEVDGMIYSKGQPVMPSHIGQIIMSTTLNTAAKVQAIYGGTWVAWGAGRVPVGVNTSDSDFSTVQKTGGEKTHKLVVNELPKVSASWTMHSQERGTGIYNQSGCANGTKINNVYMNNGSQGSGAFSYTNSWAFGNDGAHNNLQPYITVYMWRRTA